MSNKPTDCVHCFIPLAKEAVTKDHAFPRAWYTDDTPPTVQRWTVPSCKKCNGDSGEQEKELFLRLVLCIDPAKAEASGITEKLRRSLGLGSNISEKERQIRQKRLQELIAESSPYKGEETLPGLGLHQGFPRDSQKMILIPADLLFSVLKKIFRGTEYFLNNHRYIKPPHEIKIYHVHEEPGDVKGLMEKFASTTCLGPGFKISRVSIPDDPVLYKATIWGTLVSYASIDVA